MANSGSIGLAFGAALIGLGAVFAAFLAMRLLSAAAKAFGGVKAVPPPPSPEKPQAVRVAPQTGVQPHPPAAAQPAKGPAPGGEVAAAISLALALNGAGDEVAAAICTAIALESARPQMRVAGGWGGNAWSSAGRLDAQGRRVAVQSRPGR